MEKFLKATLVLPGRATPLSSFMLASADLLPGSPSFASRARVMGCLLSQLFPEPPIHPGEHPDWCVQGRLSSSHAFQGPGPGPQRRNSGHGTQQPGAQRQPGAWGRAASYRAVSHRIGLCRKLAETFNVSAAYGFQGAGMSLPLPSYPFARQESATNRLLRFHSLEFILSSRKTYSECIACSHEKLLDLYSWYAASSHLIPSHLIPSNIISSYSDAYRSALSSLRLLESNPSFCEHVSALEAADARKLALRDLLIMPVQRLMRYPLIVRVVSRLPLDSRDCQQRYGHASGCCKICTPAAVSGHQ